jgi:hypothetical protein
MEWYWGFKKINLSSKIKSFALSIDLCSLCDKRIKHPKCPIPDKWFKHYRLLILSLKNTDYSPSLNETDPGDFSQVIITATQLHDFNSTINSAIMAAESNIWLKCFCWKYQEVSWILLDHHNNYLEITILFYSKIRLSSAILWWRYEKSSEYITNLQSVTSIDRYREVNFSKFSHEKYQVKIN